MAEIKIPIPTYGQMEKVSRNSTKPVAVPTKGMEVELKYFEDTVRATSVDKDGNVYGTRVGGTKHNTIIRTEDSFENIIEGHKFDAEESVVTVIKTKQKYIVVTRNAVSLTGSIYTSDNFSSGFTKAVTITNAYPDSFTVSWYFGEFADMIFVGEYGQTGTSKKLHFSRNGGTTWSVLKETTVVNSGQNSHWHHAMFDEYRGRIWVSQGDGDNAKLSYTEDFGANWKDIIVEPNNLGKTKYQPTLIIPTYDKLLMAPDTDNIPASVLSLTMDNEYKTLNSETFKLNWEHSVWDKEYCYYHYGVGPYIKDGGEIYMVFPNASGKKMNFIVGSGDGGNTFYNILTVYDSSFGYGLVGPDKNGFIYGYHVDNFSIIRLFKAKKPGWMMK